MVYTDPQPAYADVEAGNLDSMNTVPTSALSTFESDDQVQAVNEPGIVSRSFTFAALGPLCPIAFWRGGAHALSTTAGR